METKQTKTSAEQDSDIIRIKKYPNRRLYDTANSKYIVLDDIVELVRSGQNFIVEDTKTGEDITRSILNQVIYERETANADYHFPLDVQKQLILMYDDAYGKMMPDYLRESMNLFVSERDRMKDAFDNMVSHNSRTMAEIGDKLAAQNVEYFSRAFDFFQAMSGMRAVSDTGKKGVDMDKDSDDKATKLEDIQSQIIELQKQLKALQD